MLARGAAAGSRSASATDLWGPSRSRRERPARSAPVTAVAPPRSFAVCAAQDDEWNRALGTVRLKMKSTAVAAVLRCTAIVRGCYSAAATGETLM